MSAKELTRTKVKSYDIDGQTYNIPNICEIDSKTDTTGVIDQWPAFSSKRQISNNQVMLTNSKRLIVADQNNTKFPNLVPKPKYLQYLEEYLQKELKKHGCEKIGSGDVRLDIYREVFEWLLEAFKTYKPILAEIKREYEEAISKLRQEIRELEPMKEMIWTISEEKNKEVLEIKHSEKQEITRLKASKYELYKKIGGLEADQITLEIQLETLKTNLSEEYHLRRNEADARKLLIIDMNDLRQQLEDLNRRQDNEIESMDDPVVLRLGLEEAKRCNSQLQSKLIQMETDYADVVPKRDYDQLLDNHSTLTEKSTENSEKLLQLEAEHAALEDKVTAQQQQRDFYYSKYMDLAKSSTPRPEWQKCEEVVTSGPSWWQEQSKDKSSKQLMEMLLQDIEMSSKIKEKVDAKGLDVSVMPFLRSEGLINLRYMSKRDVKIHIQEIWSGRKIIKEEQIDAIAKSKEYLMPPLADYVDHFFRKTYGIEKIRLEWAYTFNECLGNEKEDKNIIQFRKILIGEMDEEVYWQEMLFLNNIHNNFKSKDPEGNNLIDREEIKSVIEGIHLWKSDEEEINTLLGLILSETGALETEQSLPYEKLFLASDEGEYGSFLNAVKMKFVAENDLYIEDLEKEFRDMGAKISPAQLRECFQIVDPDAPSNLVDRHVCWCFSLASIDDTDRVESVAVEDILYRLTMGAVKRIALKI